MAKNLHHVLPVYHLKEAEKEYVDAGDLVGPYIEAMRTDNGEDWEGFYDHLTELLPVAGDNEDVFFNKNTGDIENFDILSAAVHKALSPIKKEIEGRVVVPDGYHVTGSKKLDDSSVAVTMEPDVDNRQNIEADQKRSADDIVQAEIDKLKRIHYEGLGVGPDLIDEMLKDRVVKDGEVVSFGRDGKVAGVGNVVYDSDYDLPPPPRAPR